MKQWIVDHNPSVSGKALVSSLLLCAANEEGGEKVDGRLISSDDNIVQYHALGLLCYTKKADRLA
jgi:hypothetical protein